MDSGLGWAAGFFLVEGASCLADAASSALVRVYQQNLIGGSQRFGTSLISLFRRCQLKKSPPPGSV